MSKYSLQEEKLETCLEELKIVFPLHYAELALNQDKVPLDPDYDQYLMAETMGRLLMVTIRERLNGELVGYFVGFVAPHLHYRTCITCTMDIFYVKTGRRGQFLGVKLFKFVERLARIRGVHRWYVGSKCHADASKLFEYLGFTKCETYYSKWLGD